MKAPKHAEEQPKGDELKRKPSDKHIAANLLLFALPIIRTGNSRATSLYEERDDVADDKDGCKSFSGDAKNAMMRGGQDGADEAADEEVISRGDKHGREDGKRQCHDERDL